MHSYQQSRLYYWQIKSQNRKTAMENSSTNNNSEQFRQPTGEENATVSANHSTIAPVEVETTSANDETKKSETESEIHEDKPTEQPVISEELVEETELLQEKQHESPAEKSIETSDQNNNIEISPAAIIDNSIEKADDIKETEKSSEALVEETIIPGLEQDAHDESNTVQIDPIHEQTDNIVDEAQQQAQLTQMEVDPQEVIPDNTDDTTKNVEPEIVQPASAAPVVEENSSVEPSVEPPTEQPIDEPIETADIVLSDAPTINQIHDDFIVSEEDLQSVSAFYSISVDILAKNKELFTSLLFKFHEFEQLKSNKQILEVNYEQFQHSFKKKMENSKKECINAKKEVELLKADQKQMEEQKVQLENTLNNINSSSDKKNKLLEDMKVKIVELEKSKSNISELLENKQNQINSINEEIKTLNSENREIRKNLLETETSKEGLNSDLMKYKYETNKLEREIQLTNESKSWFEAELKTKIQELDQVRSEQGSKLATALRELDNLKQKYEINESSLKNCKAELINLSSKNEESQFQIKNLTDKLATQESQYLEKLSKRDEHIQVLDTSLKDKNQRIESLNKLYEKTSEQVKLDEADYRKKFENLESQIIEKDIRIEQLEADIKELTNETTVLGNGGIRVSPFAQKTLDGMESQLSLTDLLSDLTALKKEVVKERRAKLKAEEELSGVLTELEHKWPILESYKDKCEDYALKQQKMEVIVNNLTNDKRNLNKTSEMLKKKVNESQLQIRNLTKYKTDLQRQLVVLLSELYYKNSGESMLTSEERNQINQIVNSYGKIRDTDESDTDKLITTRLTTFKDTFELVKQNEKLLTISRQLGDDLEGKDADGTRLLEEAESITIQKAKDAIAKLQDKVNSLETQLTAAINSKDVLQNLFDSGVARIGDKGDIDSTQERISSLLEELKSKKKELSTIRQTYDTKIFELNGTIQKFVSEKAEVSLQLSKEVSTNELNKEKINNLNSNIDLIKQENNQLKSMLEKTQENLSKLELKLQTANASLMKNQSDIVEFEIKVKTLTAEKNVWKATEDQLRDDIIKLYNEKSESNKLIVRLQTLDGERQAHFKETMQKFNNNSELHQKEVDALRAKLDKSSSEISNILHSKNVDSKVYQKRIDLLSEEITFVKDTLTTKEKIIQDLTTELETLKKRNAAIGERKQSVLTSIANSTTSSNDVVVLREELKNALEDLDVATNDANQYKELSSATEQQLNALNEAYTQYKQFSQEKIDSYAAEVEALKETISKLENEKDSLKSEFDSLTNSSDLSKQEYTLKISELNSTISTFESIKENYEKKLELLKGEVEIKESSISDLNNLVNDKNNQLVAIQTINDIVKKDCDELKITLQENNNKLIELETSLGEEKVKNTDVISKFEQELRNDKIRISELETQNRTLLNQLEESPLSFNESDDMKSLVTYLNREKDSLTQQLNYVKGEESVLRQSINMKEKEINNLKSELTIVKEKSSTIDKYSEALSKMKGEVEELKVYKENNNGLREQIKLYEGRINQLEHSLNDLNSKFIPLTTEIESLKQEIINKEQANATLNLQIQTLQSQLESHNQAATKGEQKDIQLQELQSKYEEKTQIVEKLKNEFNEKLKKLRGEKQQLFDEGKELSTKVQALEQQLATISNSASSTAVNNGDAEKLKSQLRLLKEEVHKKTIENSTLVSSNAEKLDKLSKELSALKKELEESRESGNVKQQSEDLIALEQKYIKEKEEALSKLESELKANGLGMSQSAIDEFKKKLKAENDLEFQKEIEAHKVKIRAPSQAKINEIVERRVKAKSEELEKQYQEKIKSLGNDNDTNSSSNANLEEQKAELLKKFELEKEQLKKDIRAAVEKEKEFKEKFLQGKITRLEEKIRKIEDEKKSAPLPNMAMPIMPNMANLPDMQTMMNSMNGMPSFNFANTNTPNQFNNMNPFGNVNTNMLANKDGKSKPNALNLPTKPAKRNLGNSDEPEKKPKNE